MIRIHQCSNSLYWYRDHVGQVIPLIREDRDYYWAREPEGYINIVDKRDGTIEQSESE